MTQEIFEQIEEAFDAFKEEHQGKSKAAHQRARKALTKIKNLIPLYKKASVNEDKK